MLLLIYCLMCFPLYMGGFVFVFVLVCITLCPVSFAIITKRKRELVVLLLLSYGCLVTVNVLWPFLTSPLVSIQCVIVVIPDHTQLLFKY